MKKFSFSHFLAVIANVILQELLRNNKKTSETIELRTRSFLMFVEILVTGSQEALRYRNRFKRTGSIPPDVTHLPCSYDSVANRYFHAIIQLYRFYCGEGWIPSIPMIKRCDTVDVSCGLDVVLNNYLPELNFRTVRMAQMKKTVHNFIAKIMEMLNTCG